MEPVLTTAPAQHAICEELQQREPIFHVAKFGTTHREYEQMMDADYWEVGASGRRYSREFILEILQTRTPDAAEILWAKSDFHCRELAPNNYLVTYTLVQGARISRRSTLWRKTPVGWKILYHQGTLVAAVDSPNRSTAKK
jgi:hypothetical protein